MSNCEDWPIDAIMGSTATQSNNYMAHYDKEVQRFSLTFHSTPLAVNTEQPYIHFKRLPKDELALAIVEAKPLALTTGPGDKNDFLVNNPRKTVSQLVESNQVEQCIVMCTIAAIESDMGWYYLSCKVCSKKVLNVPNDNIDEQEDEDEMGFHYYCVKCKVKNPKLMQRYKLHLVVLDNTGNSKFLLFDAIAMQILNRPCNELTGSNFEEMQDPEDIPLALKDLVAAIESDMGWYYLSCKVCSKKVLNVPNDNIDEQEDEDEMGFHYYCVKCKVKNPKLMQRYKLHLVVLDNTGNSKFLLFDAIAMQILNRPCNELTGSNFEEMQDPEDIPLALKDLVGKTYLFKIGIEREFSL
ncbi:hypothetical protein F2Q69_00054107 [Brassica cretica]|uniref:Replication factor A C-terminal domain-containing protein n=1 Tax=Brassica cretica TaxID=69181 RepID=A0A8S9MMT3_BRACR|nr:hypothetical protein F2Q69_00054107 [Brassica cretica]